MAAPYFLAVDVGTSRTAAATARIRDDGTISTASFPLGRHSDSAPSVVFVGEGELLFGDAAARRGIAHPERVLREFTRRIGDDVPILAGDRQLLPEQLYAQTVAWAVENVIEREGQPPLAVSVTVPASWTEFRIGLVRSAIAREGWSDISVIAEPVAAARHYEAEWPLPPGRLIAVFDLGGGTFDTAVLRKDETDEIVVLGEPGGMDAFGGSDFDDIVVRHVLAAAGRSARDLRGGAAERVALAALRRECVEAKEALSFDSETVIPVLLADGYATVRLTRSEFEGMIEAGIATAIDLMADAFDSTSVDVADVEAILLTGGSSRIPRVAQLLSERFDRPVAVDADPKAIIALGAARVAADSARRARVVDAEEDAEEELPEPGSATSRPPRRRRWFGRGMATASTTAPRIPVHLSDRPLSIPEPL